MLQLRAKSQGWTLPVLKGAEPVLYPGPNLVDNQWLRLSLWMDAIGLN